MRFSGHILFTLVLSLAAISAAAQKNTISFGWGGSIPAGGGNFRNEASWLAPSLDWEYHIRPRLSAGVSVGYGHTNEEGVTHDRFDGALVDGASSRKVSLLPLQARLRYFPLGQRSILRPFVSVSGGAQYARFDITGEAISSSGTKNWGGLFAAGLGVRCYPARARGFFVELSGGWQWAGNEFEIMNTKSQRSVELRLGVGFSM